MKAGDLAVSKTTVGVTSPLHSLWERQPCPGVNECNRLFTTVKNFLPCANLGDGRWGWPGLLL